MNIIWSIKNFLCGGTKTLLPYEYWIIEQAIRFLPEQASMVLKKQISEVVWVQRHNGHRIVHIFLNKRIKDLVPRFDVPSDNYYIACVEHIVGNEKRSSKIGTFNGFLCSIESRETRNLKDLKCGFSLVSIKTEKIKQKGEAGIIDRFEHRD
jgi:hypothetical protein